MKLTDFSRDLVNLQNPLFRFALTLTRNEERAKDLLQETSLTALGNQDKFQENTNFKGWAFTIMRNLFINDYNKLVRNQTFLYRMTDSTAEIPYDAKVDGNYDQQVVNKAIAKLDERSRKLFSLYLLEYKYEEIAEQMDMPLGSVKSQIHLVRQKLQKKLKELSKK